MNVVKDAPVYKTMFVDRKDVVTLLERIFTAYHKDDDSFLMIDVSDIKGCLITTEITGEKDGE